MALRGKVMRTAALLMLLTVPSFLSWAGPQLSLVAGSGLPSLGLACHDQEGAPRFMLGLNPGLGLGFRHFLISDGPFPKGAGLFWGGGTVLCFWPYLELGVARLFRAQSERPFCISLGLLYLPPVKFSNFLKPPEARLIPFIGLNVFLPFFERPLEQPEEEEAEPQEVRIPESETESVFESESHLNFNP